MRKDRLLRLEKILGLLDDLRSPKDSIKKDLHQKFFDFIKYRTFVRDFEKLIELDIIEKYKTKIEWTKREDKILKDFSKNLTLIDIQENFLPYRTIHMLRHRSRKLKLNLHQYSTTTWNRHWTKSELFVLTKGGELNLSIPEIQEKIPLRTKMSISLKLWNLGFKTKQHKDEDYLSKPWSKKEEVLLKKWYPLIGTGNSERRRLIETPNILDIIPNRTERSIFSKSFKLGLEYNPQDGLKKYEKRCLLCLKIKDRINDFSGLKKKEVYCKECKNYINRKKKYKRKELEIFEILGSSLQRNYVRNYSEHVTRKVCIENIQSVINKDGYKCFFEDEYCGNGHLKNLTIDHIVPYSKISNKYDFINPNNLMILCFNHNVMKSDVQLVDLKKCWGNMLSKIKSNTDNNR